ncbi:MAG: glycosyltransferase [Microbacterium sp.]
MTFVAVGTALVGGALFVLGLVLPFIAARLDREREPERDDRAIERHSTIEVVIAAYLEASVIGAAVERLRRQLTAWDGGATVTVVASDDATADAAEAAGAHVLRTLPQGKAIAVNTGVRLSTADIVLLTDANCAFVPDGWPILLAEALKSGDLISARKRETGSRESAFWRYEDAVKRSGADHKPTMSVVGEFLAFRREDFEPIPPACLVDDIWIAKSFAMRGLRVRIASGIATTEAPAEGKDQWERRIRIAAGLWVEAVPEWRALMRIPAGRQFLAHKLYRLTIGAAGFWLAVVATAVAFRPWGLLVVPALIAAAALYYTRGRGGVLTPLATLVTLQIVPILALVRARTVKRNRRAGVVSLGWKKIAR